MLIEIIYFFKWTSNNIQLIFIHKKIDIRKNIYVEITKSLDITL